MTKEEMMEALEAFIQHGKYQVKTAEGAMVTFLRENGNKKDVAQKAIDAIERKGPVTEG
jgi:adenosine/AMP kinase